MTLINTLTFLMDELGEGENEALEEMRREDARKKFLEQVNNQQRGDNNPRKNKKLQEYYGGEVKEKEFLRTISW